MLIEYILAKGIFKEEQKSYRQNVQKFIQFTIKIDIENQKRKYK